MSTEQDLLYPILCDPAEDAARLVMADWLEEQGQGERADLIRVQIEMETVPPCEHEAEMAVSPGRCRRCQLVCGDAYLRTHDLPMETWGVPPDWFVTRGAAPPDWKGEPRYVAWAGLRRGFIESVALPWAAFERHAAALFAAHPIMAVTLADEVRVAHAGPTIRAIWPLARGDRTFGVRRWPRVLFPGQDVISYGSRGAALADLSSRCGAWGRELAGLPQLAREGAVRTRNSPRGGSRSFAT